MANHAEAWKEKRKELAQHGAKIVWSRIFAVTNSQFLQKIDG